MEGNLAQNWPVYLGVGGYVVFTIYAIINSRQQEKKDKEAQNKDNVKDKGGNP